MGRKLNSGFTLIELMVVITIIATIAVWGVPSYKQFMDRKRVDSAINQIAASIKLVRSQAMVTGQKATLCGLNEPRTACSATPEDWSDAWGILVGTNVFQVYDAPKNLTITGASIEVSANGLRSGSGAVSIIVTPEGGGSGKKIAIGAASLSFNIEDI